MTVAATFWRNSVLIVFCAIWLVYFALLALLPITSAYDNIGLAVAYQAGFVALVALPLLVLPAPKIELKSARYDTTAMVVGLVLSAFAISSLLVDRMTSGVDFSQGVCVARNQMTAAGAERGGGISSAFSVMGHLFSYCFLVPVALVLTREVSRAKFWAVGIIAFACLMALSVVAASRAGILLTGAFVAGMLCIRAMSGHIPRIRWIDVLLTVVVGATAMWFILAQFGCRAEASGMTATEYLKNFAPFLGAEVEIQAQEQQWGVTKEVPEQPPAISRAGGMVGMVVLYATHSAYTFAGIISSPSDEGMILFETARVLLSKAGIELGESTWALAGRFTSLPGALYHDLGKAGLVIGSILLGIISWAALWLVGRFGSSIVIVGATSAVCAILFLSPIHFAADFMAFPFMCFGFVIVPAVAWLIARLRHSLPALKATSK